jgi:hypothetical protein
MGDELDLEQIRRRCNNAWASCSNRPCSMPAMPARSTNAFACTAVTMADEAIAVARLIGPAAQLCIRCAESAERQLK